MVEKILNNTHEGSLHSSTLTEFTENNDAAVSACI